MRPRTYRRVVVYPTQILLRPPHLLFQGGPDWPGFWFRTRTRHCRYAVPVPLDLRPSPRPQPVASEPGGVWCGPVTHHFGHAIADFGGRLAHSSQLPPDVPLVFSTAPGHRTAPAFLYEVLARFGVMPERVRLIDRPTVFERLLVFRQAERLFGGAPEPGYLDLLDRLAGDEPAADGSRLFVSRAARPSGRIAGESYLEHAMQAAGFDTLRPEMFSLDEQLSRYRRASHIVFSEGSAIHALQLLGHLRAHVSVIVRRPGSRIARTLIAPRVASLRYVDCVRGVVHGVRSGGGRQVSAGMSILDEGAWLRSMKAAGVDLERHWDGKQFLEARDTDIEAWIRHRHVRPAHPKELAVVERSMRHSGLIGRRGSLDRSQPGVALLPKGAAEGRLPVPR